MRRTSFNEGLAVFLWILVLMIFQTAANDLIRINNIVPDLFFAFVVSFACVKKNFRFVTVVAMICGIVSDFVCHSGFVGYTAIYTYSAALGYYLKNMFIKPNIFFLSVIALILFIAGKTLLYPVFKITANAAFAEYFVSDTIPAAFYNVLCFFVMILIFRIAEKRGGNKDAADI